MLSIGETNFTIVLRIFPVKTMAFVAPQLWGSSYSSYGEAKQLMPVPVDGRLKMVAKRMLQAGMRRILGLWDWISPAFCCEFYGNDREF
jgi:hypothetical protein